MAAISFPTSPTVGQQVNVSGNIYTWDGTVWQISNVNTPLSIDDLSDVDLTTNAPVSGDFLKYDGANWIPDMPEGGFMASTGTLAARPASPTTNHFYVVSGNSPTIQNGRTFFYNLSTTTWIEIEPIISRRGLDDLSDVDAMTGLLGQVLMVTSGVYKFMDLFGTGTLAARPTITAQNFLYVVTGDSTATNNGRAFLYSKSALAWVELDTKISNRSIDELKDVDTTTSAPVNNSLMKYDGTNWVPGQAYTGVTSATPPAFSTIVPGTIWINSDTLEQFVYVVDGSGNNVWITSGNPNASAAFGLADLSDINLTTPANGDYIYYDSATSEWKNKPLLPGRAGRNRIANGDMRISQKHLGATLTSLANGSDFAVDKFQYYSFSTSGLFTIGKNLHGSLPLDGFPDYLGVRCGSTSSDFSTAGHQAHIDYLIEPNEISDLRLGTSEAKSFTLSFWYYVSIAGTYSVSFRNRYGGSGTISQMRCYVHDFTMPANTWTKVTVTVPPITSGGFWNTNFVGLIIHWPLGSNSIYRTSTVGSWITPTSAMLYSSTSAVQLLSNANATLALTGVQLEAGTAATPFESLDHMTALNRCKRYYFDYKFTNNSVMEPIGFGVVGSVNTIVYTSINFPVEMMKLPAVTVSGAVIAYDYTSGTSTNITAVTVDQYGKNNAVLRFTLASASTTGKVLHIFASTTNGFFSVDANVNITD